MKTFVIGHQKPDLDSVVAAISFAELLTLRGESEVIPVIIDQANNETEFVFKKFNVELPHLISASDISSTDKIVLVDHNEDSQRLPGINQDQIIKIFDHHKANLNLSNPIEVSIQPVGSSNTLAWMLFKQAHFNIPESLGKLMLCSILSDTVGLKSSTTTDKDIEAVKELSSSTGVSNIEELTLEIFKAKSNIASLTDEQVVLNDYKVFDFSGKKVFIGQIETVEQDFLLNNRKAGLVAALGQVKTKEAVDFAFLTVTDILKVNSKLILSSTEDQDLATKSFGGQVIDGILDIGPKMSRKKDIAPLIDKALQN